MALLESAIFCLPTRMVMARRRAVRNGKPLFPKETEITPPPGITRGVPQEIYDGYRIGLDSACVDVVVTTVDPKKGPCVLLVQRGMNKPFGGKLWVMGGAAQAYRPIQEFLLERCETECGLRPRLESFLGVFRTCAEDMVASTTNLAFVGHVEFSEINAAKADADHAGVRLFNLAELDDLTAEQHPYPMLLGRLALVSMP